MRKPHRHLLRFWRELRASKFGKKAEYICIKCRLIVTLGKPYANGTECPVGLDDSKTYSVKR